jgi:hypothetical protein
MKFSEVRPERNKVIATFEGVPDLVDREVRRYFTEYMVMGYGTTIVKEQTDGNNKTVLVERCASAD